MFTFSDVVCESSALDGVLDEEYDGAYGMMVSKQWSLRTQHDKSSKQTRALNRAKEAWPDADRQDGISTVVDCLMSECNAESSRLRFSDGPMNSPRCPAQSAFTQTECNAGGGAAARACRTLGGS